MNKLTILYCTALLAGIAWAQNEDDPYLWLEEVTGKKALEWVTQQDSVTVAALRAHHSFGEFEKESYEILNSKSRIPMPRLKGEYIYNFWNDEKNERGIWRRCKAKNYRAEKPDWETVLDIDALVKKENEKWVFKGADFLPPGNRRCLIFLSRGGGDATVMREFDLVKKEFVAGGFSLPESKMNVTWASENALYAGTDFGRESLTESGYPRVIKLWQRGTKPDDAVTLFEAEKSDVRAVAFVDRDGTNEYHFIRRGITFYTSQLLALREGRMIPLQIPADASFEGISNGQFILELKTDWDWNGETYYGGSLVSIPFGDLIRGQFLPSVVFAPDEHASIAAVNSTKNALLVKVLRNVTSELLIYTFADGRWRSKRVNAPGFGTIDIISTEHTATSFYFSYRGFLSPTTLYIADEKGKSEKLKSLPHFFDASAMKVEQNWARSKDGTRIPYFIVSRQNTVNEGTNPVLLYAYGGFEVSMQPSYSGIIGANWLKRGGVYVLANLRGGGEFGPQWHHGAIKENRQKVNDDMIAVAEDVIERKITSPGHLAIMGGSNGGLLVGSVTMQRPELFNAVVCQVPLLDMKRYHKLLAGASWVGEYGNPDVAEEWEYIKQYSPYQNVKKGLRYPPVFFVTSTRDDRVHPGHARKMAAKFSEYGIPFYYYENTEGGHGAGVTNRQIAFESALVYAYLWKQIGKEK